MKNSILFDIALIILLSQSVSTQEPREIVVCSSSVTGSENGFFLDCGADSVIEIETAKVAHYFYGNPCSYAGIMPWMRSDTQQISCKLHVPLPRCDVVQSCVIDDSMVEKWIGTCAFLEGLQPRLGVHSNVLYVKYSCFKFDKSNTIILGENRSVFGPKINVLSPNFPCNIPNGVYDVSCDVRPQIFVGQMDFTRRHFNIPCFLYLHVQKFSQSTVKYFDICEDNSDFTVSLNVRWKINFQSSLYDVGGKFWIEVEYWSDLDVTCKTRVIEPVERIITEDETCQLFPVPRSPWEATNSSNSSTAATTTNTTVTHKLPAPTATNGTSTTNVNTSSNITLTTISLTATISSPTVPTMTTQTMTTTTTTRTMEEATKPGAEYDQPANETSTTISSRGNVTDTEFMWFDEDKSGDSVLPEVVGGLLGIIVMLLVVTIVMCCKWRKGEQKKDQGSAHLVLESIPKSAASHDMVEETTDQSSNVIKMRDHRTGTYESVLVIDTNVMYAKVDKSSKVKSKIEDESQADESISDSGLENIDEEDITMFENTDLYDTVDGDENNTCIKKNYHSVVGDNSNNGCDSDSEVIYQDSEVCTPPPVELTGDSNDITSKLGRVFEDFT